MIQHAKHLLLGFIIIFISSGFAQAQLLNVESIRADADTSGWYGQLNFNLSLSQYDDQVLQFTNNTNISFFSEKYQYNNNLGLQNRFLAGAGFRYTLFNSDSWEGSFSSSVMAEYEEWQEDGLPLVENEYIKSSSNLSLRGILNPQTSFLLIGYYQARPSEFFEARSILETQLQVKINKHISLSVQFAASYDADPVIDIPNWTYELSNGLVIKF